MRRKMFFDCQAALYFLLGIVCSVSIRGIIYSMKPPEYEFHLPPSKALNTFSLGCTPPSNLRILCYINTVPATYFTKAIHVKRTWGCRCTKILFFSSQTEPSIPVIDLNLTKPESRMHLWSKMRKIVRYVYQYRDDYDYFYKADDDNYLFVENLADELNKRNPDEPFMMGYRFPRFQRDGYLSGGAGYVLSRGALKVLIERAIDKHPSCPTYDEDKEDVKMSVCGVAVGVKLFDAWDRLHRNKFNWVSPENKFARCKWLMRPIIGKNDRSWRMPTSFRVISFHYVLPETMYLIEFASRFIRLPELTPPAENTTKLGVLRPS